LRECAAATHVADTFAAAAAGLPTLVEKPPAADAGAAAMLATLVPPPWIGFNRRFDPLIERVRGRVPAHGRLELSIELRYRRGSWRPHTVTDATHS